jgi:hypothetical protein
LRAEIRERDDDEDIEVEPENVRAVRLFIALDTQWRLQPLSNGKKMVLARTGLDYAPIPGICTALCITFDETLLAQLRVLESETLRIHRARTSKMLG